MLLASYGHSPWRRPFRHVRPQALEYGQLLDHDFSRGFRGGSDSQCMGCGGTHQAQQTASGTPLASAAKHERRLDFVTETTEQPRTYHILVQASLRHGHAPLNPSVLDGLAPDAYTQSTPTLTLAEAAAARRGGLHPMISISEDFMGSAGRWLNPTSNPMLCLGEKKPRGCATAGSVKIQRLRALAVAYPAPMTTRPSQRTSILVESATDALAYGWPGIAKPKRVLQMLVPRYIAEARSERFQSEFGEYFVFSSSTSLTVRALFAHGDRMDCSGLRGQNLPTLYKRREMKFFATALVAAMMVGNAVAQSLSILSPSAGASYAPGATVQLIITGSVPATSGGVESACVVGILKCVVSCISPASDIGTVLYDSTYAPAHHISGPGPSSEVYQVIDVVVPSSATAGNWILGVTHPIYTDSGEELSYEYASVTLSVT
uniref:Uncharacterized protein n=1 Tax=Mycena chlorophos TaxID=658473 RepID=A0ABQ0LIP3_MYCCL|nr:predicted protein [Mycena chlorophos]